MQIEIFSYDETYIQISADKSILQEISDYFCFDVPGAKFMPSYKYKQWDGKIRLYNYRNSTLYKGLMLYLENFALERDYEIVFHDGLKQIENPDFLAEEFCDTLGLIYKPHDFQIKAVEHCVKNSRAVVISPTSSGKSLIMYVLVRWFLDNLPENENILLIVPTVTLVGQLITEFKKYAPEFPIHEYIHAIYEGKEKNPPKGKRLVISTWQSVYKMHKNYFGQYGMIMVDEAHSMKSDALKGILEKCPDVKYRFGLTGTLNDTECHRLIIEGLCGKAWQVVKTDELMKRGIVSDLSISCVILEYQEEIRKENSKFTYQQEIDFIVNFEPRNRFLASLAGSTKKDDNILILTDYHQKKPHIRLIKEALEKAGIDKKILICHGGISIEEREEIRSIIEETNGVILIATFGSIGTGTSINNIQYVFYASNSKSMIKVLQSIGRGLRLDGKTNRVKLIDIVDSFGWKKKKNYLLRHLIERIKIYTDQNFKFKIKKVELK